MKMRCLLIILVWLPISVFSQSKIWTLKDCIEYALENNISIKQSELNVEMNKLGLDQSRLSVLPGLNANAGQSYNFGKKVDPFTNEFGENRVQTNNFSIQTGITLFSGFTKLNTIKENQYAFLASKYDCEKMKNDISLNVALAYMQVLFNEDLVIIAQNQLELTLSQVQRTEKLVEAGTLAKGSLLQIQAQAASEELQLVNARNQLNMSYLNLTQMLELPGVEGFVILKPEIKVNAEALKGDVQGLFNTAVSTQPEIKSAEYKVLAAEKGLAVSRGGLSPQLQLSASYGTGYSSASKIFSGTVFNGYNISGITSGGDTVFSPSFDAVYKNQSYTDQLNKNMNKSIGLYLTIPIFNGYQARTNISRSKISVLNAQYNSELAKNQLHKNIQQAWADASAAFQKAQSSQKSVDALLESFNYIQQKFDVGMVNVIDYNTAKNNLTKAQSDLLQAKYDFVFRLKVLDFYQGKSIILE